MFTDYDRSHFRIIEDQDEALVANVVARGDFEARLRRGGLMLTPQAREQWYGRVRGKNKAHNEKEH